MRNVIIGFMLIIIGGFIVLANTKFINAGNFFSWVVGAGLIVLGCSILKHETLGRW